MCPTKVAPFEISETALTVEVPSAEPLVRSLRERYDPSAAHGMPAHITIPYPFLRRERLDEGVLAALRDLFAARPPRACWRITSTALIRSRWPVGGSALIDSRGRRVALLETTRVRVVPAARASSRRSVAGRARALPDRSADVRRPGRDTGDR
nr:hypothetical protein [Microbispora rosea]